MAQFESILGDESQSSQSSKNKQNNVTAFNKQPARNETSASFEGQGSSRTSPGNGKSGAATAKARTFYDQAKETAGQAYETVTDKAATKLDEKKSTLSGGLTTVADSVRQVGENLGSSKTDSGLAEAAAKYTDSAAQKIEDVAGYFESRGVRDMVRDLEGFARRNPAVFFGAAFGLGLLAARFLKSSTPTYEKAAGGREVGSFSSNPSHRTDASTEKSQQVSTTPKAI
ncbi:MAG: hypothetical protein ABI857_09965 [Acidobacteriota bacterium]